MEETGRVAHLKHGADIHLNKVESFPLAWQLGVSKHHVRPAKAVITKERDFDNS